MRLQLSCPTCSKPLELLEETAFSETETLKSYKCGHSFVVDTLTEAEKATQTGELDFTSCDGKKHARHYQEEGVKFILDSDFACVLADQMRLGKTPQALIALKNAIAQGKKSKALILVRAANMYQWVREIKTWVSPLPDSVWIIQGTKNWIPDGFTCYVCSMDTFGRKGMSDQLLEFGFDVVIADEAHSFKNPDSNRSKSLVAFLKQIEQSSLEQDWNFTCPFCPMDKETGHGVIWTEKVTIDVNSLEATKATYKSSHCPKCFAVVTQRAANHIKVDRKCGILMLTGTPIKNRADEYFIPLNLISPEKFPSITSFRRNWLTQDSKGKWSRVKSYYANQFKETIKPFVLRREKEDIYTDLPKLNRIFTPIEMSDEKLKKAYNQVLDIIESNATPSGSFKYFENIGHLQILRQICGLSKVQFVADYANEFIEDSEKPKKLAIGVHHHSVRDGMKVALNGTASVSLDGTDNPERKDYIAHKYFPQSQEQVLILGMMAAKEGLELPYIDTAIVMEREWSSADEEQFEYRFYNPDPDYLKARGLENKVTNIEYIIAKDTIDEFFYDLVESKRAIFGETVSHNWSLDQDASSFQELMQRTLASRLK